MADNLNTAFIEFAKKRKGIFTNFVCIIFIGSGGVSWGASCEKGVPASIGGKPLTLINEWLPRAEKGNAIAQYKLATMYDYGVLRNPKTALKWYTLAAKQGNIDAQNNLGGMYKKGKGVPQNYKTAVKWYTLAAENGCADAGFNLGSMHFRGNGVLKDLQIARLWWGFAAKRGHPGGQKMINISNPWWKFWAFYGWWRFW
jgi:TPR repeat protein